jgi:hypothetical protein
LQPHSSLRSALIATTRCLSGSKTRALRFKDAFDEAYVEDIVVKSKKIDDLVPDLTEVFAKLRHHGVKLNPEKSIFRVPNGMLLGFVVSERGIEANPKKISAITNMGPIKNLKGVQRVIGCLAALNRFIAQLGEHSL